MRRRALAALVAVALLSGCTAEPRPLSAVEAERLAMIRYTAYEAKILGVRARVPAPGGALVLDGRVDVAEHVGYATLRTEGRDDDASAGLLQWSLGKVAFNGTRSAAPVDPPPVEGWQLRPMQTSGSELDGVLRLVLNLGSDRPENAQLLQQSTARWVGSEDVRGKRVDVFEGPRASGGGSRLKYWVDGDGRLHRVQARMGENQEPAVVDLVPGGAPITALAPLTG
ncbi:hypothetical protein [Allokutzneria albata]|uniref:Lipoprotein LprG n=1 Tax=Allokutzneria albata TaxID=211114 RepID=A0A1G9VWG3_ALLAB|nr:hypothetical protein [Allokutzneria albata]SDM76195.1 hypothetical protein SAMN04489726_3257 [Allokutzneria albata]